MANTIVTPSIVAKEALRLLDNNLVFGSLVNRAYEDEFDKKSNGNRIGDTVLIRKPVRYTVRSGAVASPQDTTEKTVSLQVNTQEGVDLQFSSSDLSLKIADFSDRYLKSAMIQLANSVDLKLAALYKDVWNWVGTPGTALTTFAGFTKAPQRLDEMAVPDADRVAALNPADKWGLIGGFTGFFAPEITKSAIMRAKLPPLGSVDAYSSQNVPTHTTGARGGTPLVNGAAQNVAYDGSNQQNLVTDGWTATTGSLKKGDVFTIAGVFAVNPVTKAVLSYLQQFVAKADATADGTGNMTLSVSPAIITTGPYQTVSAAPADNAAITNLGSNSTGYPQNVVFDRNAFALAMVPMELPKVRSVPRARPIRVSRSASFRTMTGPTTSGTGAWIFSMA
jgi:hypothetical protein